MNFSQINYKYQNHIATFNLNVFGWIVLLNYLVPQHDSVGLDILVADFSSSSSSGLKMVFLRERNMVTTFHL